MTAVLTFKHTCDEHGNWTRVPVILTRGPKGWSDRKKEALDIKEAKK